MMKVQLYRKPTDVQRRVRVAFRSVAGLARAILWAGSIYAGMNSSADRTSSMVLFFQWRLKLSSVPNVLLRIRST